MALFGANSGGTLADVLNNQADTAEMGINNQFAKKRRQAIATAGANGRLGSGVQNYTEGDINAEQVGAIGGVESQLASALGAIPAADYANQNEAQRQQELVDQINAENRRKRSVLAGVLSGAGSGAALGGTVGGPWGAVIGGVGGGIAGGVGANNY